MAVQIKVGCCCIFWLAFGCCTRYHRYSGMAEWLAHWLLCCFDQLLGAARPWKLVKIRLCAKWFGYFVQNDPVVIIIRWPTFGFKPKNNVFASFFLFCSFWICHAKNVKKAFFDQRLECATTKHWLKYTTVGAVFMLSLQSLATNCVQIKNLATWNRVAIKCNYKFCRPEVSICPHWKERK